MDDRNLKCGKNVPWNKTYWADILKNTYNLKDMGGKGDCMFYTIAPVVESTAAILREFLADTITDEDAVNFQHMLEGDDGDSLILDGLNVVLSPDTWSVEDRKILEEEVSKGKKLSRKELSEDITIFFAKALLDNKEDISCVIRNMMTYGTCNIDIYYKDDPKVVGFTYEGTFWALDRLSQLLTSYRIIPIDYSTNSLIVLPQYDKENMNMNIRRNIIIWYSGNHYQLAVPKNLDTLWSPNTYLPEEIQKAFNI